MVEGAILVDKFLVGSSWLHGCVHWMPFFPVLVVEYPRSCLDTAHQYHGRNRHWNLLPVALCSLHPSAHPSYQSIFAVASEDVVDALEP